MGQSLIMAKELWGVARDHPGRFIGWLLANLGGLLIAYGAGATIWFLQRAWPSLLPGPEVWLMAGTISLAIAGASYVVSGNRPNIRLSPFLSISWWVIALSVYGILVALGATEPVVSEVWIWGLAVGFTFLALTWASLLWLHEQGLKGEDQEEFEAPSSPPINLIESARNLPKVE